MITQYSYGNNTNPNLSNNVIDRLKEWSAAEIRADLDKNRSKMVCVFENIGYNINIACAIRSMNAFLGRECYIVGRRRYDSRGACGTNHYEHVFHADTLQEVYDKLSGDGYRFVAVDNIMECSPKNIWDAEFQEKTAFVFGSESAGLSQDAIELCNEMVYIKQDGSVRSMNVACAASCVMAEYTRRFRRSA